MLAASAPEGGDVVVRSRRDESGTVYVLGTPLAPDQLILHTHDEAVSQALGFAKAQHVRAWYADGDDECVLLGSFQEEAEPAG